MNDPDYLKNQAAADAQHAAAHPVLDAAQKLAGSSAGLAVGGLPGAGLYVVDAKNDVKDGIRRMSTMLSLVQGLHS